MLSYGLLFNCLRLFASLFINFILQFKSTVPGWALFITSETILSLNTSKNHNLTLLERSLHQFGDKPNADSIDRRVFDLGDQLTWVRS